MIQAAGRLFYRTRLAPGRPPGARVARGRQSATAASLERDLRAQSGLLEGPASRAHSRAMAAVAVAETGAVGIDVEYRARGRDIISIARFLMGERPGDEDAAYRVWTVWEAYFKAFGAEPPGEIMRAAARAGEGAPYLAGAGLHVLHETPAPDFVLTLLWSADASPVRLSETPS